MEEREQIDYQRKQKALQTLHRISQELDQTKTLPQVVVPVLQILGEMLGFKRGVVTLLNRQADELQIDASYGLTSQEELRGSYLPGEGIVGRVIKSGETAIVPDISRKGALLNRTGRSREELGEGVAQVCVPVTIEKTPVGAMSFELHNPTGSVPEDEVQILEIVASMIAQAVNARRQIKEERERRGEFDTDGIKEGHGEFRPSNMLGGSRAMQEVFDLIQRIRCSNTTVLIRGESGTGKELVAHAIHHNSLREGKPLVKVSCAALPESVIESELFGHEKGAFTNAIAMRKGRFEIANGGTIFLDEIGDLSLTTQVKLLRILQEREFERVGGSETMQCDVRVIAATNRPLEDAIEKNQFREDLYYRLNVFPIHIPPLRDRRSDITLLADAFTEKYAGQNGKRIRRISTPAIELLMSYHWPGNVRELENCIERAVLLSTDGVIHGNHLPPTLQSAESTDTQLGSSLEGAVWALEKELIQDALKSSGGSIVGAARRLGVTERKLGVRIEKYGIRRERYKTKK